jgi:phospholipid/cholesterol/gamma-HCH transport system substrate-binding protein
MRSNQITTPPAEPFVRRHRPFFVTLFVLIPIVTMPALLIFTMIKSDRFQKWYTAHVFYENSFGLKKGNTVSMSGITIGHVKGVDLIREGEVHVHLNINGRYKHLVRKDTRARLKQRGFVGDWEVELTGGTLDFREIEDEDTLRSERMPVLDDVIELAADIIDTGIILLGNIASIIRGIEAGEGTIGQFLKNDTLFRHASRIAANAVLITSDVKKVTAEVRGTIQNADSLLLTITDIGRSSTALIDTVMNTMGTLVTTANEAIGNIDEILKNIKSVSGELPEFMDRLQHDLGEVEQMLRSFQESWLGRRITGPPPGNPHLADTP